MADRKTVDVEIAGVDDLPFGQRRELHGNRRPPLAPQACQHADDEIERAGPAVHGHHFGRLP
jgi:hypothetical protein